MPRFVVLEHRWSQPGERPDHFDLLIETTGDNLFQSRDVWAFELACWPPREDRLVIRPLPDHRSVFLWYEGPLSHDRGQVIRRDEGQCQLAMAHDGEKTLEYRGRSGQTRRLILPLAFPAPLRPSPPARGR